MSHKYNTHLQIPILGTRYSITEKTPISKRVSFPNRSSSQINGPEVADPVFPRPTPMERKPILAIFFLKTENEIIWCCRSKFLILSQAKFTCDDYL